MKPQQTNVTIQEIDTGDVDSFEAILREQRRPTKRKSHKPTQPMSEGVQVVTSRSWIESFVSSCPGNKERKYKLRVAIAGYWMTPRDIDDFFRDLGVAYLEPILHHKPLKTNHIVLVYPERWLSVHEQHRLIWQLDHHPEVLAGTFKGLDILTQTPLIVQNCYKGELSLVHMEHSRGLRECELEEIIRGKPVEQVMEEAAHTRQRRIAHD